MASKFEILLQARLDKTNSDAQIRQDIKSLEKKLSLNLDLKADSKSATQIKNAISGVGDAAKKAQEHTQGLGDIVGKFSSWQIVGDVIHGVKDAMVDMVDQVFELDASLTELDKVTDLTEAGLNQLTDDAFAVGQQIGATGKDVIDATTIFAQAGYEAQEALDLSEQAIMLKNVSEAGATAEKSASTLIATMKAFGLEAEDSGHIVDALNEVSNKYAVSVNDLSTAIQKSAASMATGNNTLEETFGLVTAGVEILQEPGRVANGLSTITARLTAENDAYIKSITGGQGVIDEQTGELRSTYDILQDLSEAWEGLTSVEQQELAETVAGKTQRSLFTAIMTNFESAVGATQAALESEGSAAAENEKRMQSLEGRLTSLQSAWQSFANNTIDSDFIKNILSAITAIIQFVDSIGGLPVVLATATSLLIAFKGALVMDKVIKAFITGITGIKNGISTLIMALPNAITAFKSFSAGVISAGTAIQAALPLLSVIALAITAVVSAVNLSTQAIKEETAAAIENSQEAEKVISSKEQQKESIENEIKELENEIKAYKDNTDARDNNSDNKDFIQSKEEEIQKRKENIDAINEEIEAEMLQREASVRSMSVDDADWTKLGLGNIWTSLSGDDYVRYQEMLDESNDALDEAGSNVGAYKRKLEELRAEYEKQAQEKEKNGESSAAETEIIRDLNNEIEDNAEKYEEASKTAAELYDIVLDGGDITDKALKSGENALDWMKEFYGLTDEQIQQLKDGNDVLNQTTEETEALTDATDDASEAMEYEVEKIDNVITSLKDEIDQMDTIQSAYKTLQGVVDEYNESGSLTIDTLQSLLSLDPSYLANLQMVNGQLQLNTDAFYAQVDAMKTAAIQNLQSAAAQDILAYSTQDTSNMSDIAKQAIAEMGGKAQGVVTDFNNATNAVATFTSSVNDMIKTMNNGQGVDLDDAGAQAIMNKYKNLADGIANIKIDFSSSIGGSSGGSSGSSKKSSGSSSSKSSADTYKAEINTLYKYENALDNAKDAVDRLNDALDNTDNFEEQEKILKQLIDATNDEIDATEDLKDAQVDQINDYIRQLKKYGFQINYNSKTNELYIKNMDRLGKYTGDTAKKLEEMIEEIQDLNDDNRDLDSSIRDLTGDIQDFNEQLDELPTEKLEKFQDLLDEFQQSRLDQIQNEIDDIQHDMDNDPRLQALEEQIEALEKQNEELDNQKDLEEKLLAVEEAKIALQNAQNEKNIQVYREGQGWVWEADPDAIADAQEELEQAQEDLNDKLKDDQLQALEDEKEAIEQSYQDRIDALEDFLDEQEYLIDKANREGIQSFDELREALEKYGLDSKEYLGQATEWLNNYNKELDKLRENLDDLGVSGGLQDGLIYSSDMQDRIDAALSNTPEVDTSLLTSRAINANTVGATQNSTIYINSIELPNVQNANDFVEALKDLPRLASSQSTLRT